VSLFRRSRIRRTRRGTYRVELPEEERDLLRRLLPQLRSLLADEDPGDGRTRRLHPPAYTDDDDADADYLRRMMARVEGMPLGALEEGLDWEWRSFAEYLDRFEGNLGVNAGFLVGHCAIRRTVMGDEAVSGQPTADQLESMQQLLADSIAGGGLGFSSSQAYTHASPLTLYSTSTHDTEPPTF